MRIETAKGSFSGTLAQCWAWQEEYQGSLATLDVDGVTVDISECNSVEDCAREIRGMLIEDKEPW